jgi:transcriptional regulator with XRE-family HTH domain
MRTLPGVAMLWRLLLYIHVLSMAAFREGGARTYEHRPDCLKRGHLSEIESGKRSISLLTLQTIAKGMETTMSKLLRGI